VQSIVTAEPRRFVRPDGRLDLDLLLREFSEFWTEHGDILSGSATIESKGREIYEMMLRVASGEASKSEAQGLGDYEFVPWQIGAVM